MNIAWLIAFGLWLLCLLWHNIRPSKWALLFLWMMVGVEWGVILTELIL